MRFTRFVSVFLVVAMFLTISASAASVGGRNITSAGAIVIDYETGETLYAYNADVARSPASLVKMMTVYLVYEAIKDGRISTKTIVPISSKVYSLSRDTGQTNVPLNYNANYTVDELLNVTIVVSACGAARALAELLGGTEANFISMMNKKAAEWKINANFTSSYGGTIGKVTPRAMAVITRNSIKDYPEILSKTAMWRTTFRRRSCTNTNQLLGVYSGIDGFKTGTNKAAGQCFIGTAKRGETRIITVTMGSRGGNRFKDTAALLDYGFDAKTPKHPAFSDVPVTASYYDALDWAYNREIFLGSGGRFNPKGAMTRGNFCLVLWRMAGSPEPNIPDIPGGMFKDMKNPLHAQYDAITWASENKIMLGSGGKCNPNGILTRGQMATMLYRYNVAKKGDTTSDKDALKKFSDRGGMSSAAAEHMRWAVTHKIIQGSGGKLNWRGKTTREAAVIVLYRYNNAFGGG